MYDIFYIMIHFNTIIMDAVVLLYILYKVYAP